MTARTHIAASPACAGEEAQWPISASTGRLGAFPTSAANLKFQWPEYTFVHNAGTKLSNVTYFAEALQRGSAGGSEVSDEVTVTILVVEDDQLIQGMVEEALSDGGFRSAIIGSGEEAVTLLRSNSEYRAVVTDINLLGTLDGWDVARVARERYPSIPIIYMTGTHGEDWTSKGVPESVLLVKPFAAAQIVTALSNLLNAGAHR